MLKNEKRNCHTKVERADIGEMVEMAAKHGSQAAAEQYGTDYYVSKQAVHKAATVMRADKSFKRMKKFEGAKLQEWQHAIKRLIEMQSSREILFVVDEIGNKGKTWLAQYLSMLENGQTFNNTNKKDVAYAMDTEKNLDIFDITRAVEPKMSLQILESIKNGTMFSGKYESATKIVEDAKIVVICNAFNKTHTHQLSLDRFLILRLDQYMSRVMYKLEYFNRAGDRVVVSDQNNPQGNLKAIIDKMAESTTKRRKRQFCRWAAELPKWGYNVKKNLRVRQFR